MARERAVQILLYLQVPVSAGGMPVGSYLAQLTGPTLCAAPVVALACRTEHLGIAQADTSGLYSPAHMTYEALCGHSVHAVQHEAHLELCRDMPLGSQQVNIQRCFSDCYEETHDSLRQSMNGTGISE